MSSGVEIDQSVLDVYNDVKLRKKHAYVVLMIKDKKKIVVETMGDKLPPNCTQVQNEAIFNNMKRSFGDEPRYILFDFCFTRANQTVAQKLAFIAWCNDECAVGKKMLYASSKDALKKVFVGLNTEFQCTDATELQHSELVKELVSKVRV